MDTGYKADKEKNRLDLWPVTPYLKVGEVLTYGANKYAPDNWRGGMAWSRLYAATLRHLMAWWMGQSKDPESGISHLAHAACNLMFLIEYEESKLGTDDRRINTNNSPSVHNS